MPRVLPRTSYDPAGDLSHSPRCARAFRRGTQQHHDLGNDQLGNTARVGERRIEHGDPERLGGAEVDLIRPDAEGAHRNEFRGGSEYLGRQLGPRPDADHVRVGDGVLEPRPVERTRVLLDVRVAVGLQRVDGAAVDRLQQDDLDQRLVERNLRRGGGHSHWGIVARRAGHCQKSPADLARDEQCRNAAMPNAANEELLGIPGIPGILGIPGADPRQPALT